MTKKLFLIFPSVLIYSFALIFANNQYLIEQQWAPFFHYIDIDVFSFGILVPTLFFLSLFTPVGLNKVSDIFLVIFLPFLYIPSVVFAISFDDNLIIKCIILSFSYFVIAVFPKFLGNTAKRNAIKIPYAKFFMFIYIICGILFFIKYYKIMSISSLDEIYAQRIIGKATSRLDGYLQTYFGYVISLSIFTYGLYNKSKLRLLLGMAGCFLLYMVTAEKTIFLMPFFIFIVYLVLKKQSNFLKSYSCFLILSGIFFVSIGLFYKYSLAFDLTGFLYLGRVVATPGIFFNQYLDFFSNFGYTNYSHITGFNLIFEADNFLGTDPLFPSLGEIFARYYQGINSNSNASFLATDGAAAYGFVGVIIVSFLISFYLMAINFLTRTYPASFVIPLFTPIAFILTNGSLFTILLSFGGLFWLILLFVNNLIAGIHCEKK